MTTWPGLLTVTACRMYLALLLSLVLWAALPTVLGWKAVVVSTGSMQPRVPAGSILVVSPLPAHEVRVGQVVLVDDPVRSGELLSHRLVGRTADGALLTRGDANSADDSTPVPAGDLHGVGRLLVPAIGLPVQWSESGRWLPLALWLSLTTAAAVAVGATRTRRHPGRFTAARRAVPHPAAIIGVTVLVVSGGVASAPSANAALTAATRNPGSSWALSPNATFGTSNYSAAVNATSPTFFYRANEASGTVATDSRTATPKDPGTYAGTVGYQAPGCTPRETPNTGIAFNGTNTQITQNAAAHTGPQTFSVEVWFRTTTTTTGGRLIGFGDLKTGLSASYDRHLYMTNTGQLIFGVFPGALRATPATATRYNDGTCHHAVATLSTTGLSLYVDGVLVASFASTAGAQVFSGAWRVGGDNLNGWTGRPTSNYFAGTLDEIAVYEGRVLSPAEVSAHYYAA